MKGWKDVGVWLPASITKIIKAAGGADPKHGGMPYAMAAIVGALPWIAVQLYQELTPEEYAEFAAQTRGNMGVAWSIIGAENPKAAFDAAFANAKRQVQ